MPGNIHPTERFRKQLIRLRSEDGWYKEIMAPGLQLTLCVPRVIRDYHEWRSLTDEVWSGMHTNAMHRNFRLDCYRDGMWEYKEYA